MEAFGLPSLIARRSATILVICLGIVLPSSHVRAAVQFSPDSALAHLHVLAGEIGPRPMGSPAERKAFAYALDVLKRAGCQDTFFMPLTAADGDNTNSGIAVGVLRGTTGRIIVVGGHIDSEGPDIPGANDNGSGAATVLELARVLSATAQSSTIMFCLWGGEEQGLIGSTYFVHHFKDIDSVALMVQLDMVDGAGALDVDPDASRQVSAPRWLVDAAFDIFYNDLHAEGLRYPTQFATLNNSFSAAAGSDHQPFLQQGIPAIDFTSEVDYPIHTPMDNLSLFQPSGFARAGNLALGLVHRFDKGQPSRETEKYWLVQAGTVPLFIPHPVIRGFAILAILVACWVLAGMLRREDSLPGSRVPFSGAKLLALTLVLNIAGWQSPDIVGLLNGSRYPWAAHFQAFLLYGSGVALVVYLGVLAGFPNVRISSSSALLFLRAIILPVAVTILCVWFDLELAVYTAAVLLLMTAAVYLRRPWIGLLMLLLGLVIAARIVFGESTGIFLRMLNASGPHGFLAWLLYDAVFVLISTVMTLPFVYAAAAYVKRLPPERPGPYRRAWLPAIGVVAGVAMVLYSAVLAFMVHPYDETWQPRLALRQSYGESAGRTLLQATASESLRNVEFAIAGHDTVIGGSPSDIFLPVPPLSPDAWCAVETWDLPPTVNDSLTTIQRLLTVRTPVRPFTLKVTFSSSRPFEIVSPFLIAEPGGMSGTRSGWTMKTLSWYSFPEVPLRIPVRLVLTRGQLVRQEVDAAFDSLATSVDVKGFPGYVQRRLHVVRSDSIRVQ